MTDFNHDEWVKHMQSLGHMAETDQPETPESPVEVDLSVANVEPSDVVEVKYQGRGAYEAAGVEVSRHGQTVEVPATVATELTGLTDEDGKPLFEEV